MAHGVTYDDVAESAWSVLRDGRYPSVQSVRHVLGTGSTTTINKHLQSFWSSLGDMHESPALDGIPDTLASAFRDLWGQAKAEAIGRLDEERRQAQLRIEEAQEQTAAIREDCRGLEDRNTQLSDRVTALDNGLREERSAHTDTQKKLDDNAHLLSEARQQTNAAQEAKTLAERYGREQRDQLSAENERLKADLKERDQAYAERLHTVETRAEEQQNHWLKEIDTVRQEASDQSQQQRERIKASETLAADRAQELKVHRREAAKQNEQWRTLADSLRAELADTTKMLRSEADSARSEANEFKNANTELRERMAAAEQSIKHWEKLYQAEASQVATLREQLGRQSDATDKAPGKSE